MNLPSGWFSVLDNTNQRLAAKIATASEVAPTVTFTGGAAGDTCSAQMAAFRGVPIDRLTHKTQANASAQDIATPALMLYEIVDLGNFDQDDLANVIDNALIIHVAWKESAWTSVAPPALFTEIGEPSSTLGNDQGMTWAYWFQGTASGVATSSFVVTGGAAAISNAGIVALRTDVVTLTVTRSVNGVVKEHPAGTSLELAEPHVLAL